MKLTVIGQWGGYPKKNEASSGYLLEVQGFKLLIDCGSGVLSSLQEHIEAYELDAAVLSHYHPDHTADIGVLQHALLIQKYLGKHSKTLPFYGHSEDQNGFQSLTYKDLMKGIAFNPMEVLQVGPFAITFLRTKHPVPCYAMRIEAGGKTVVFTADSAYQDSFISFAKDADVLLCECNFYGDMDGTGAGHMNSLDAGKVSHGAGVKKLILTHLPHYGELDKLIREAASIYKGEIMLARKNLQIHL
ncbi:MBL fold metallo-hydrolase [Bacillus sp. AK031]